MQYARDLFDGRRRRRWRRGWCGCWSRWRPIRGCGSAEVEVLDAGGSSGSWLRAGTTPARRVPAQTLAELFEAQVAAQPDAVAVVGRERGADYAELDDAGEPAGVAAGRSGAPGRSGWSRWRWPVGWSWWSRCWRWPRPGRRICRSTRATRPSGSRSCSADARSGAAGDRHGDGGSAAGRQGRHGCVLDDPAVTAALAGHVAAAR